MHDVNFQRLKVGDRVDVPCVVVALETTDDFCNATLETVHGRRPDDKPDRIAINTGVTEKVAGTRITTP